MTGCKGCQKRQEWLDKNAPRVGRLTRKANQAGTKAVEAVKKRVRDIR